MMIINATVLLKIIGYNVGIRSISIKGENNSYSKGLKPLWITLLY
jgi:hypothetical protein